MLTLPTDPEDPRVHREAQYQHLKSKYQKGRTKSLTECLKEIQIQCQSSRK